MQKEKAIHPIDAAAGTVLEKLRFEKGESREDLAQIIAQTPDQVALFERGEERGEHSCDKPFRSITGFHLQFFFENAPECTPKVTKAALDFANDFFMRITKGKLNVQKPVDVETALELFSILTLLPPSQQQQRLLEMAKDFALSYMHNQVLIAG